MKKLLFIMLMGVSSTLFAQSDTTAIYIRNEESGPETDLLIKANTDVAAGNFKAALQKIDQALALNPKSADAYNARGMVKVSLHDLKGALADLNTAIADGQNSVPVNLSKAYSNRGNVKEQLRDHPGAIADLKKAIFLNPNNAIAQLNMGNTLAHSRKFADAIKYYDKAIKLNYSLGNAYNNRGLAKYLSGNKPGGCADMQRASLMGFEEAKQNLAYYCK